MKPDFAPTHKQLVRRVAGWLRVSREFRSKVVLAELVTQADETPDVLGFISNGVSILIECKVSRADFKSDAMKSFRQFEDSGVGNYRYFAAPAGLLKPEEMPAGWGLLELDKRCTFKVKTADWKAGNKQKEVAMLLSAMRRLEISTAVFVA